MSVRLSEGAIAAIMQGENVSKPVLQVINTRAIATGTGPPRYRVLMSDGVNTLSSFMLATQLNPLVEEERLSARCVCQVNRFIVNSLKDGRRVVILMDLNVLHTADEVGGHIGNPQPYNEGQGQQRPAAPAANPAPSKPQQQNGNLSAAGPAAPKYHAPSNQFGKASAPSAVKTPGGSQAKVVPIASLNPYQSKWTICARVTQKGQIRTWSNSRGEGKLFSIELVDESGEIRATAFNDQADKFFPLIELNKVYYFTKGNLKTANKQYTAVKNDYEITFTNETSVVPCDDAQHLPSVQFDFVSISDLENTPKDSIVDVIGICKSYEDVTKITVKANNREVSKRNVHLMDTSGKLVTATLWGNEAEQFDGSRQPVIAIKGARVSDFGGRSLSVLSSSTVVINPDSPEAFKLRGWFDSEGQLLECASISDVRGGPAAGANTNWKTLFEAKSENLGQGDKADYFSCVGTIVHLRKENCMYQACPSQDCNKKVIDQQNGLYRCEKCDREFPNFKYRMMLLVTIADCLEYQWVTCFQESAEFILGQSAAFLGELKEKNEQAFEEVFQNANFNTYEFRIRVKLETYNDESRIKATAMDVKPVNYREYSKRLIANIRRNAQLG
ncbi:PREDICTED: replication protein A 70 kDa DNA-binding subunit [Lepidothrix coronata]|uniref:Replication protein A subunit n=2 Tax=Pipridae TaxID=114313 RepID=A0A6J0INA0_9PASS|nr:PREDICTED: replication protein A 70 kDa DNA-binding subunit [Lepidothrix coronata]XP_051665751.1 replication protein A 70 kDa DNA-binding subunit [Manacus candei]